jgi:hypothetical protein
MKLPRRQFLHLAAGAAALPAVSRFALADLGGTPLLGSPAEFGKLIADEIEKWAKVINSAGIKAE